MTEPKVETVDLVEDWDDLGIERKLEVLKETVTVPEVAELLGFEVDSSGKIPSPWNPDERTPSCHLYDDHFYDYSNGRWGDMVDLVQAFDPGLTLGRIVHMIRNKAVSVGKTHGDVELRQPREVLDFAAELAPLTDYDVQFGPFDSPTYLGLDVRDYGLKLHEGNVLVPHREPGRVYGVKVRYGGGGKGSWAGSQYTHRLYDPLGWVWTEPRPQVAVIAEGESDAWALDNHFAGDAAVFGLPSGVGTWRDHWLDDLEPFKRILICMDNDAAGKKCLDKLLLKVGYARAEPLRVPKLYDDARSAIEAGWEPSLY